MDSCLDLEFTMSELKRALAGCVLLKHLHDNSLYGILDLFNKILNDKLPSWWKSALILTFVKPGKAPDNTGNYTPIALTSHLCKLMEKMIVKRLDYFLENKGLIKWFSQRKVHRRMPIVKMSNEVEKTLHMKEVMAVIFLNIEKAYDYMWKDY